ncbi:hypothetical protein F5Y16DRAFT_418408 [Xylariaceae sp. FL0255]|nr:hypothetical protein F5Y16DRAFT_418408 [Xylariaceae sp. FL0255]
MPENSILPVNVLANVSNHKTARDVIREQLGEEGREVLNYCDNRPRLFEEVLRLPRALVNSDFISPKTVGHAQYDQRHSCYISQAENRHVDVDNVRIMRTYGNLASVLYGGSHAPTVSIIVVRVIPAAVRLPLKLSLTNDELTAYYFASEAAIEPTPTPTSRPSPVAIPSTAPASAFLPTPTPTPTSQPTSMFREFRAGPSAAFTSVPTPIPTHISYPLTTATPKRQQERTVSANPRKRVRADTETRPQNDRVVFRFELENLTWTFQHNEVAGNPPEEHQDEERQRSYIKRDPEEREVIVISDSEDSDAVPLARRRKSGSRGA